MTAQIRDKVRFRGEDYWLETGTRPLEPYFQKHGRPPFVPQHTGMYLGYYATWEVVDNRLYLTEVSGAFSTWFGCDEGYLHNGLRQAFANEADVERKIQQYCTDKYRSLGGLRVPLPEGGQSVAFFFPGQTKAFADWFSGELWLPQGEVEFDCEGYWIHMYPSCIFLTIEQGVVVKEREVKNPPPPWEKAAD